MRRFFTTFFLLQIALLCYCQTMYVIGEYMYYLDHETQTFTFGLETSYTGELNSIPQTCHYDKKDYTYAGLSKNAFRYCSHLTKVVVPEGTKSIPDYAFANCDALETVVLPKDIETIGDYAFYCCFVLKNLVIPENVSVIGRSGLYRTNALERLIYLPMEQPNGWQVNEFNYIRPGAHYDKRDADYIQAYRHGEVIEMITWGDNNHIYDGLEHELNYTCNIPYFHASLAQPYTKRNAGDYNEELLVTFSNDTITFSTYIQCSYQISKVNLIAIADNKVKFYGDTNPSFSITLEGLIDENDREDVINSITANCIADKWSEVGDYPITLSGQNTNYNVTFIPGVLTIEKAPLIASVKAIVR